MSDVASLRWFIRRLAGSRKPARRDVGPSSRGPADRQMKRSRSVAGNRKWGRSIGRVVARSAPPAVRHVRARHIRSSLLRLGLVTTPASAGRAMGRQRAARVDDHAEFCCRRCCRVLCAAAARCVSIATVGASAGRAGAAHLWTSVASSALSSRAAAGATWFGLDRRPKVTRTSIGRRAPSTPTALV